jgi:hypothetical protein
MRSAIARNDTVMILKIGNIIAKRRTENVCQLTARFFQDDLRAARVPELRPRTQVNVNVALGFGDQADL